MSFNLYWCAALLLAAVSGFPGARSAVGQPATQPLPALREYHIRVFTTDNGLPSSEVRALLQGNGGFMYVAGRTGLSRFDGHGFYNVPLAGFRSPVLTAMLQGRRDRLWVRNADGEIGFLEHGRFTAVGAPPVPFDVWNETDDGTLWLGGAAGLIALNTATLKYRHFTMDDGLPELAVIGVFDLTNGERILVTDRYLARVLPDKGRPSGIRFERFGNSFTYARNIVQPVRVDSTGLWFTAYPVRGPEMMVRYSAGRVTHYPVNEDNLSLPIDSLDLRPDAVSGQSVVSPAHARLFSIPAVNAQIIRADQYVVTAMQTRDKDMWLAITDTKQSAVHLYRRRAGHLQLVVLDEALYLTRISHIIEDHEGSIWVGTDRGLLQLTPRRVFALTPADGLAADFTAPILQSRDGSLWVGTWGGGVQRFRDGHVSAQFTTADKLPSNQIRALHEDATGAMWVGTSLGYAIVRGANVQDAVITREDVRGFVETKDGVMWIATAGRLLRRTAIATTEMYARQLQDLGIWALHMDPTGALWIGGDRGLFRLYNNSLHQFTEADGLRSTAIASITDGPDGTVWIGTYGFGLHRWRAKTFVPVTTREGLHDDGVWRLLIDRDGAAWMSSDRGISRVSYRELNAVADDIERGRVPARKLAPLVFTEADGMPNRESNRGSPAGWLLNDGRLVFNNLEGVVVIDPRQLRNPLPIPHVVVQSVSADGHATLDSTSGRVHVPAGTRRLEFSFVALSFVAPLQNRYRYRLDPLDRGWVDGGTSRNATYTNVRPGRYTFHVQAANPNGDWSNADEPTELVIMPLYYETWWFRVIGVLMICGILYGAYRYRVHRLLEVQRLRLRIASDLHDDIGSNLSAIALLSDMLQDRVRPEDANHQQLVRIQQTASGTIEALRDIIWLVNPAHDALPDFELRLRSIADDMLQGITWTFECSLTDTVSVGMAAKRHLLLLYKEMLHNVRKHAEACLVTIRLTVDGGMLVLVVEDDGIGFERERHTTGNGLRTMQSRAEQIGATLSINRGASGGTVASISMPIP